MYHVLLRDASFWDFLFASSEEFVGEFRLRKGSEVVI